MENTKSKNPIKIKFEEQVFWALSKAPCKYKLGMKEYTEEEKSYSFEELLERANGSNYKNCIINIIMPTNVVDEDLEILKEDKYKELKGRMRINIRGCERLTYKIFPYIEGIYGLDMSYCQNLLIEEPYSEKEKMAKYVAVIPELNIENCPKKWTNSVDKLRKENGLWKNEFGSYNKIKVIISENKTNGVNL